MIGCELVDCEAVDELPELELEDVPVPHGFESYEEQFVDVELAGRPWPDAVRHQLLKILLTSASQAQTLVQTWCIAKELLNALLISSLHICEIQQPKSETKSGVWHQHVVFRSHGKVKKEVPVQNN